MHYLQLSKCCHKYIHVSLLFNSMYTTESSSASKIQITSVNQPHLYILSLLSIDCIIYRLSFIYNIIICLSDNLTPYGTATQSSWLDGGHGHARFAIQPPISNAFSMTICTHTATLSDQPAWWMFQFSFGSAFITEIQLYYRHGGKF